MESKWIVGVDEAGRGPLAGPVTVGLVCVETDFDWELLPGIADSKKLSERKREIVFERANELQREGKLRFVVKSVSAHSIDSKGIAPAIRRSITAGLEQLGCDPADTLVKLDGSLRAPDDFQHQETIIKGDDKELVIGLASIMAKVTRDHYMIKQAAQYPEYDFAQHKGYGTKAHREAIAQYGFSPLHRRSYCKNIKML